MDALALCALQDAHAAIQMCRAAIGDWAALYALPQRAGRRVVEAECAARALQQGVSRALVRHGPFDSGRTAAALADYWLLHAGRRRRWRRLVLGNRANLTAAGQSSTAPG